ncbi:MAG: hypothetical protein KBT35_01050 [Firmicutes bacterium]|nr:hypothetical protein [Candidatus Colivicinus equi]
MKRFEHINHEMRKIISNYLSKGKKAIEIANDLGLDVSAVSKEIKRNRIVTKEAYSNAKDPICEKTTRFPYVCNGCSLKYSCHKKQYKYDTKRAQEFADYRLIASRRGINLTKEEFDILNNKIHDGLANGNSIYHIVISNDDISSSVSTVYRYINNGYLTTKKIDLPYACTYKKRKKSNKKYEYRENSKINRSNRTYLDYLSYSRRHPNLYTVQMDFLGSIKSDSKSILTLTIPTIHFVMLILIDKPNSKKIVSLFNYLDFFLDTNFTTVFPIILTDRDPSFADYEGIESDALTGEIRTNVFYCDAFKSNQKANVENMNKQLRKYFPKGKSIDHYTQKEITEINMFINNQKLHSLSGFSANDAFIKIYGKDTLQRLYDGLINYFEII